MVEQVDCQVQLQHRSAGSFIRLLFGRLTVEPIPNPYLGVSSFLFCPPDGPAAVGHSSAVPALIGDPSGGLALGALTSCTQPPSIDLSFVGYITKG